VRRGIEAIAALGGQSEHGSQEERGKERFHY
jgi:hypothetical protein